MAALIGGCGTKGAKSEWPEPTQVPIAEKSETSYEETKLPETPNVDLGPVEFCGATWEPDERQIDCHDGLNTEPDRLRALKVTDLTPLSSLTGLIALKLDGIPISDLTPLIGLTVLRDLRLSRTHVSDLTPLAGLTNLDVLFLSDTKVTDLSPLSGLTELTHLDIRDTSITDAQVKMLKKQLPNLHSIHR